MKKKNILMLAGIVFIPLVLLILYVIVLIPNLPSVESLKDWHPPEATVVYDYKNRVFGDVALQRRYYVDIENIPPHVRNAFISAEDRNFYRHFGIDPIAIVRALIVNLISRDVTQGGSTITQQLAKNLFLTPEKSITRKIKEAILAIKIERTFQKDKILEMYLNYIYLGQGAYGVEAASRVYFGKSVKELSVEEAAVLASLPKAPSRFNPFRNPDRLKERRDYILYRMYEDGYISNEEYERLIQKPIKVNIESRYYGMDYFLDYLKDYLVEKYGEQILRGGYKVYTTIDRDLQNHAQEVLKRGVLRVAKANGIPILPEDPYQAEKMYQQQVVEEKPGKVYISKVLGFMGNEVKISLGDKEFILPRNNLTLEKGDYVFVRFYKKGKSLSLDILPDLQGALVSLDASTGAIRAMVGGYSYLRSPYNRAVYAKRQPGSAIKPIIYLAALMKGYTQVSLIDATPRSFYDPSTGKDWTPSNYEGAEYGTLTLRQALAKSVNTATVNLLADIGFDTPIEIGRLLGIELKPYYSMALGSIEVTPMELVSAFQAFASMGNYCKPYFIQKIVAPDGSILEEQSPQCQVVLPAQETRVLVDMLRAVVLEGTAVAASSMDRIVAGKTGTTNDYADAWFIGFSPNIVTGVWVGFDLRKSMGKGMAGARVALPIWIDFMSVAAFMYPKEDFPLLDGTVIVDCPQPMVFVEGTQSVCNKQLQESKEKGNELEGIVDPKFLKNPEGPKIKEVP